MNRRKNRDALIEIRRKDQELYKLRMEAEIRKIETDIRMAKFNRNTIKEEMKNLYRECVLEVKKEKK